MPNIVGIGNSQVPTNAMLGGLAYQDSVGEIDIEKIKARTSDTAVDIFVYDTRKDSDGGAWRHRTQNLSWYNEGANAFRGARKEFPTVAVIVSTSSNIIIYDGDDPNLSMWMEFNGSAGWLNGATPAALSAKNGIMTVGSNTTNQRLRIVFFLKDYCEDWATANSGGGQRASKGNFLGRNSDSSTGRTLDSTIGIVNRTINDVAMTVLPNAPIDIATGIQVPTIAAATATGISIIKDDGTTVVDMRPTGSSVSQAKEIYFTKSNKIAFTHGANWVYYYPIPSSTTTATYWNGLADFIGRFTDTQRDWSTTGIPIEVAANGITNFIEDRAIGHTNGLQLIDINEGGSLGLGMHCGISTDFNTGWQHGDIKCAFLSDTDATNVTGTEYVTNGNFTSGLSGWTSQVNTGGSITVNGSNQAVIVSQDGSNRTELQQTVVVPKGVDLIYSFTLVSGSIYNGGFGSSNLGAGTYSWVFNYAGTGNQTINLWFTPPGWSGSGTIDNISIRHAEQDRSINGGVGSGGNPRRNGLAVYGTITKEPVATGAELVSYSGFNGSNYLRQPYNSNLNFGTGDFSIIVWVKKDSFTTNHYIIDRARTAPETGATWGGGTGRSYFIINSGGYHRYKLSGGAEQTGNAVTMPTGVFTQIGFVRRSGAMEFYMNGQLVQTITGSNASASFDDGVTDQTVTVNRYANGFAVDYTFDGMALLRIAGDAPSASQMKKIYDDEKCLFHENAKCTLYGTSKAVVALAHDDTGDIIHAGTSSGRSEFQGLVRINNTTTAVATAISASDGLVAEQ